MAFIDDLPKSGGNFILERSHNERRTPRRPGDRGRRWRRALRFKEGVCLHVTHIDQQRVQDGKVGYVWACAVRVSC